MKLEWNEENQTITLGKKVWDSYYPYTKPMEWVYDVLSANDIRIVGSKYNDEDDFVFKTVWVEGNEFKELPPKPPRLNMKAWNKAVGDALGCSYATQYRIFMKMQFKLFIGDDWRILRKIDYWNFRKGWDVNAYRKLKKHRAILRQTYNDGLYNLLPFVAQFGQTQQELRDVFKKAGRLADWKIVTRNSVSKNKLLVRGFSS